MAPAALAGAETEDDIPITSPAQQGPVADLPIALADALKDRYRIERELGRGGMATVYLARDLKHGRPVALKVLSPELGALLGAERFLREIETAAALQHPHILPVFDSGEAAGHLWYTMPFVEGESLRERLRRSGRLEVREAVRLTQEIASALQVAHDRGVVHRDIKPENVLLSHGQALVADFGIARVRTGQPAESLTQTGLSLGTPVYMAPEQALGASDLDGRADQYALGCVAYELLAGVPPFTGASAQAVLAAHCTAPVPDLRATRAEVPTAVASAISRAMAKSPEQRFPNALAFSAALDSPAPSDVSAPPPKATRRRLMAFALGGVLVVLAVAGGVIAGRRRAPAAEAERLVVLPFESMGDTAGSYFAEGVATAIRGQLATLPRLQVIATASSNQYRHTTKSSDQIGHELGAHYLLTGQVQWDRSGAGSARVRVSPELVDAHSGATRWQQSFDAPLTDVFRVQAEVADRVARALGAELRSSDSVKSPVRPTSNLAAYDAFLRGEALVLQYEAAGQHAISDSARYYYSLAGARDSSFALAWARLAGIMSVDYINQFRADADAKPIRDLLRRVERLAPDAPTTAYLRAQVAFNVDRDTAKAFAAIRDGLSRFPTDPDLVQFAGALEFQVGHTDSALAYARQGLALDPRNKRLLITGGFVALHTRRYGEARLLLDRAEILMPGNPEPVAWRVATYLGEGDLDAARRLLANPPPGVDPTLLLQSFLENVADVWVLDSAQRRAVIELPASTYGDFAALKPLTVAEILDVEGDEAGARRWADSAARALPSAPAAYKANPGYPLAVAEAAMFRGDASEARRAAADAIKRVEALGIPWFAFGIRLSAGRMLARLGDREEAVRLLRNVLTETSQYSSAWIALDPGWAILRGYPPFDSLVPPPRERAKP